MYTVGLRVWRSGSINDRRPPQKRGPGKPRHLGSITRLGNRVARSSRAMKLRMWKQRAP